MKKMSVLVTIMLAISIFLVACGGGGSAAPSTALNITMDEFTFTPTSFTIPAGQQITLNLKNGGSIKHDFIILKKDTVLSGSFSHEKNMDDIYFHAELEPGHSDTFTFTAPSEPGDYQIICGIEGHFQAGMTAKLKVVAP